MQNITPHAPAPASSNEWETLTGTVTYPDDTDTIYAAIHPGGQAVTVNYRGGQDMLVIDAGHLDSFIELLKRAKDSL